MLAPWGSRHPELELFLSETLIGFASLASNSCMHISTSIPISVPSFGGLDSTWKECSKGWVRLLLSRHIICRSLVAGYIRKTCCSCSESYDFTFTVFAFTVHSQSAHFQNLTNFTAMLFRVSREFLHWFSVARYVTFHGRFPNNRVDYLFFLTTKLTT